MKNDQQPMTAMFKRFLFPNLNRWYLLRVAVLAAMAFLFFRFICRPAWTNGESMLPTYQEREFLFYWQPAYWFAKPKRGDVVVIRMAGNHIFLLKRVVAHAGETIEFRDGKLLINGTPSQEEWAALTPCDWNLEPRNVAENCVYVVGDNRSMPSSQHEFGQVELKRISGKPISFKKRGDR